MKYKTKVKYIDAIQWTGDNKEEMWKFINGDFHPSVHSVGGYLARFEDGEIKFFEEAYFKENFIEVFEAKYPTGEY